MSKSLQILNKFLGILCILISIVIVGFLIPGLLPLVKKLIALLTTFTTHARYEFSHAFLLQMIGWVIAYFTFNTGRDFIKDSKRTS